MSDTSERRFVVVQDQDEHGWCILSAYPELRTDCQSHSGKYVEAFVAELVPVEEVNAVSALVQAVEGWKAVALRSDVDYDAARRVPGLEAQMVAALVALLAVAPHWGGE